MEKQILEKLLKRGRTDFMIFRGDFPITGDFKPAYENLLKLDLIANERETDKTLITLTPDGIDANKKGLERWVNEKVYSEIKNREFVLTKETTSLEINALRDLEDNGYVYEYDKRKYKITPNKPLNFNNKEIDKKYPKFEKNEESKDVKRIPIGNKIIQFLGWFIPIIIGLLAIIEYKFNYVTTFWEWIIGNF